MSAPTAQPVRFTIDGREHVVRFGTSDDLSAGAVAVDTSLADYLRNQCNLTGTKTMCRGGMCGSCVVSVQAPNPATKSVEVRAVNSCLALLHNCQGWEITTVEDLGDRRNGYDPVQSRLAHMNGTQCGFCSPGMVMSMHSLRTSGEGVNDQSVEQHLDGNLCRCTGYRPILEAFKTFSSDSSERTQRIISDIEELSPCGGKGKGSGGPGCKGTCEGCPRAAPLLQTAAGQWSYPASLAELCAAIKAVPADKTYKLVRGNTGTGVVPSLEQFDQYISLLHVPSLSAISKTDTSLTLGAAVTLTNLIHELQLLSSARASQLIQTSGFQHFADMASHLLRVANTPVRNAASWAGNLMLKHADNVFPSDVFLLLAAAQAQVTIADEDAATSQVSVEGLLKVDMTRKVIVSITLPALDDAKYTFKSYKITPRAVSSHAYVNAAFLLALDSSSTVTEQPTLLFGGIAADFIHASNTEKFLTGKSLSDPGTVSGAIAALQGELKPTADPSMASVDYRKSLATCLLYKTILHVLGDKVPAALRSGGDDLTRPLSSGTQKYDTDNTLWPVNKAVLKLEAQAQTSGEAKFTGDEPAEPGELHGAFVLSTIAVGTWTSVDPSAALALPGVVDYIGADQVQGVNNTCSDGINTQELFSSGPIHYYGQAVGLIVAETDVIARRAVSLVKVTYKESRPPVLTIKEALKKRDGTDSPLLVDKATENGEKKKQELGCYGTPSDPGDLHTVSGEMQIGGQFHHQMELQNVRAVPRDDDQLDLFSATQDARDVCYVVSQLTGMSQNKINMSVRRLGGGFGSKLQHPSRVSGAAAVAALYLNKPIRIQLDIVTNMTMLGARLPYLVQYQAGVDDSGRIETLNLKMTDDTGFSPYASSVDRAQISASNVYRAEPWQILTDSVTTDTASNTWCRTPGSVQGTTAIERVFDHVAHEMGMDPWKVRQANFFTADTKFRYGGNLAGDIDVFQKMVKEMFAEADIDNRKASIAQFNKVNRWRKKALSLIPVRWPLFLEAKFPALVSIFGDDGSVAVSTGGIEMGQGLNTKVAQVCAKTLGVPLTSVAVKPSQNVTNPNGSGTGGSLGSDMCSMATKLACEELNERLKPFQAAGRSWLDVVRAANAAGVNLTAHAMKGPSQDWYNVFALVAAEVEIDVLTGEHRKNRVDLYEDCGTAMSPYIDVGQVEGGFMIGTGLHTVEEYRYDPDTGRKLTDSLWSYFIPSSKDIPIDFRVKLMDNSTNPIGVYNSKTTGEPPMCTTYSVLSAITQAVVEARKDAGLTDWPTLDAPGTVERTQTACQLTPDMLVIA